MKTTLLLDLDDTLLKNNIDEFLPKYLQAFSEFVADLVEPQIFIKSLMAGTQAMVQNQLPDCTLKEVFEAEFFPQIDSDPQVFQQIADQFYREIFPKLSPLTEPIPQAVAFVREAVSRNYQVAVTTNPLFPRQAIEQRLRWANLPPEEYPFELVTSYESFHFAKPDPAYFAEVLGRLGWPDSRVLVVGDDLKRDILPARSLGIQGFWLKSPEAAPLEDPNIVSGSLEEIFPWMDQKHSDFLSPDYSTPSSAIATLRATPAVLDSFGRNLPDEFWNQRPARDEWGLTEVLCHLRDVEQEVNLPRLQLVIGSENPFIPGQDTDPWAETRQYRQQDGRLAFHQFVAARRQVVALLENLDRVGWQRPARHAIFGPTRLLELVNIIAAHDRLHQQQVRQILHTLTLSA